MTHTRARYQHGSLTIEKRANGPDVWVYRWRETHTDKSKTKRKRIVGTILDFPTKTAALRAVDGLRLDINATSAATLVTYTVSDLAEHFKEVELQNGKRTARCVSVYRYHLDKLLLPTWGSYKLQDVRPIAVERWLDTLPLAPLTKSKAKTVFGTLFRHGMRYQWAGANPIAFVRCGGQRVTVPDVLTVDEIRMLLGALQEPAQTLVLVASVTGLRRGELFGLKWEDLDFTQKSIRIVRSLVDQIAGQPKTEASKRPLPMSAELAKQLQAWRSLTSFGRDEDWVFASPTSFGVKPYWPDMVLRRHILPAARRLGIHKRIGWHTFRRTAATLLLATGASVKTAQELLRHSSAEMTLSVYAQAVSEDKREAQATLATLVTRKPTQDTLTSVPAFGTLVDPNLAPQIA